VAGIIYWGQAEYIGGPGGVIMNCHWDRPEGLECADLLDARSNKIGAPS